MIQTVLKENPEKPICFCAKYDEKLDSCRETQLDKSSLLH